MEAIEVLKILKNNIYKAAAEGANYVIETIDIELIDRALSLHNVVGQSEQLCDGLHSTDFNGKCFKCGEQVFVREQK